MPKDVAVGLKVLKGMLIKVKAIALGRSTLPLWFSVSLRFEVSANERTKKSCYSFTDD